MQVLLVHENKSDFNQYFTAKLSFMDVLMFVYSKTRYKNGNKTTTANLQPQRNVKSRCVITVI